MHCERGSTKQTASKIETIFFKKWLLLTLLIVVLVFAASTGSPSWHKGNADIMTRRVGAPKFRGRITSKNAEQNRYVGELRFAEQLCLVVDEVLVGDIKARKPLLGSKAGESRLAIF